MKKIIGRLQKFNQKISTRGLTVLTTRGINGNVHGKEPFTRSHIEKQNQKRI